MLSSPVTEIMGIGPRRAGILKEEAGIETVEDLLYYIPRRYVDRSSFRSIRDCFVNETVSVSGRITDVKVSGGARKRLEVFIDDGSDTLAGVFFAGVQYFSRIFQEGETVIFAGKIGVFRHKQIVHPDFDFIDDDSRISSINTGRIVPLYRSTEKLKSQGFDSRGFRRVIRTAIDDHLSSGCDNIPGDVIGRYGFLSLSGALRAIHFPDTFQEAESARRRLAFNEIFFLLFYLSLSRQYMKLRHGGKAISTDTGLCDDFIRSLPFALTGDQSRAIEEIKRDILSPFPMNRLLQGDVGTGKTVVALATALIHIASGRQVALMAPTEILAQQHHATISSLMPSPVRCALLTGSTASGQREALYAGLASGDLDLVVGTHALIEDSVSFRNLGYIIIDEQHRFGVEQRALLRTKGSDTDLLVMTATPIPRSLSMTLFGDLDISSIRSRPAHRQSVETLAFPESRLPGVYNSLEKYISQGRQIFYVLPLIEDSEKVDLKSAVAVYEKLQGTIFTHRRVALLHGRMKQKEKDSVMKGFRKGEIDMLVSTTVIEVGIDVPNASVIVIEHAERFGLSQLHQLRGRVGRGEYRSFCVLIHPDSISEESRKRIDLMVSTDDGFTIAEEDLKLRGAGELTGSRQHGLSEFEFTDLAGDIDIIKAARDEARAAVSGLQDIKKAVDECSSRTYNGLISGIRTKRILEILS